MKTIVNNSGHVITVSNSNFSIDIPIGEKITVSDDEIGGDYNFALKKVAKSRVTERSVEEINRFGKSGPLVGLYFSRITFINMQTQFNVCDIDEIVVSEKTTEIHIWTVMFKKISLNRLLIENSKSKGKASFLNSSDRKLFLRWMIPELIITFIASLMLTVASVCMFTELYGFGERLFVVVLTLIFLCGHIKKSVYFAKFGRKK